MKQNSNIKVRPIFFSIVLFSLLGCKVNTQEYVNVVEDINKEKKELTIRDVETGELRILKCSNHGRLSNKVPFYKLIEGDTLGILTDPYYETHKELIASDFGVNVKYNKAIKQRGRKNSH
jgi:hypothetical protein